MENCKGKSSEKKGKDSSSPNNYRPISLLPNISKVFKTIINDSINSFCIDNSIIPETQFGFRHKHSTIHAVTKFTSDICWARNARDCVGTVLIDLEKAFDTVWLDGLFCKLIKKNLTASNKNTVEHVTRQTIPSKRKQQYL